MNVFQFDPIDASSAFVFAFLYGLFFGFLLAILRSWLLGIFERRE